MNQITEDVGSSDCPMFDIFNEMQIKRLIHLRCWGRSGRSQLRCIVKGVKEKTHTKDCNNDFSKVVKTTTTTDNNYPSLDDKTCD